MRIDGRRLLIALRILFALLLLAAAAGERGWIYFKTLNFIAFVVFSWLGINRISRGELRIGISSLLLGTIYYPLIAILLSRGVLVAMDLLGAALLVATMFLRAGEIDVTRHSRARLYSTAYVCVAAMLLVLVVADRSFNGFRVSANWVDHTYEVITNLADMQNAMEQAESAQRAFLITGDERLAAEQAMAEERAIQFIGRLDTLTRDSQHTQNHLRQLRSVVAQKLDFMRELNDLRRREGVSAAQTRLASRRGMILMAQISTLVSEMKEEEQQRLVQRKDQVENDAGTARLFVWVAVSITLGMLLTIAFILDRDLRRRKAAAEELRRSRDLAVESARIKSEFLANMSHEIRTPMNGVIGMSTLLLDTPLSEEQREQASIVRSSAEHLLEIVNDILDLSKIEAGKMEVEQTPFDLRALVEGVIDVVAVAAREKKIDLAVVVAPIIDRIVVGDPKRIRQVLTNLVGNAIKFTPSGGVSIEVDRNELSLIFRIIDTGIGLSRDVSERLFESFTQADTSTSRRYGGTGLGLSISRALIEKMGGEIGVESVQNFGSTFWFRLPYVGRQEERKEVAVERTIRVFAASTPMRRMIEAVALGDRFRLAGAEEPVIDTVVAELGADGHVQGVDIREVSAETGDLIIIAWSDQREQIRQLLSHRTFRFLTKPTKPSVLLKAMNGIDDERHEIWRPNDALQPVRPDARILLAEDNVVNQKVAVKQLERLGLRVDVVPDGAAAFRAIGERRYDLVLMDCQMPEVDGLEATRRIRDSESEGEHLIVIAMTANAMEGDRERCLAAGMDDYLAKPLRQEVLAETLAKWGVAIPVEK